MNKIFGILVVLLLFFLTLLSFPSFVSARSGCCSHHGGVCGCGCCDGSPLSSTCAPYYPECGGGYGSYNIYQPLPSCPVMSTYNSLTEQCECLSGYVASGNTCISKSQACSNTYGFMAQEDYLSGGCKCSSGYVWNNSRTACISGDQSCSSNFGYNAEYDSLSEKCKCRYGYVWNSTSTQCISEDESCQNQFGYNAKATLAGESCECRYGYTFNKARSKCITKDAACQERNGLMSVSNLSDECECISGYIHDGSQCVLDSNKQTYGTREVSGDESDGNVSPANDANITSEQTPTTLLLKPSPSPKLNILLPTPTPTSQKQPFNFIQWLWGIFGRKT